MKASEGECAAAGSFAERTDPVIGCSNIRDLPLPASQRQGSTATGRRRSRKTATAWRLGPFIALYYAGTAHRCLVERTACNCRGGVRPTGPIGSQNLNWAPGESRGSGHADLELDATLLGVDGFTGWGPKGAACGAWALITKKLRTSPELPPWRPIFGL